MTSSATSTDERAPLGAAWAGAPAVLAIAALLGLLLVGVAYRWHLSVPAVFLGLAWLALLGAGWALWRSFASVATESEASDLVGFENARTHLGDLMREKRTLLRAIKDAEFDRDMGKMSDDEAQQIIRVYRARAIELIRELEVGPVEAEALSPTELIDRELAARLGDVEPVVAPRAKLATSAAAVPASVAAPEREAPERAASAPAERAVHACAACDTVNDPDAAFCKKCGARLKEAES